MHQSNVCAENQNKHKELPCTPFDVRCARVSHDGLVCWSAGS